MKRALLPFCLILILASCTTVAPLESMEASYLIKVECKPGTSARNTVLFLLRQAKARDIKESSQFSSLAIEAAYYKSDNSISTLQRIEDNLRASDFVIYVELVENPGVVHESR
jgi:outer membrane PBP1 activator LpoA protein